jgi:hypothetical protein
MGLDVHTAIDILAGLTRNLSTGTVFRSREREKKRKRKMRTRLQARRDIIQFYRIPLPGLERAGSIKVASLSSIPPDLHTCNAGLSCCRLFHSITACADRRLSGPS